MSEWKILGSEASEGTGRATGEGPESNALIGRRRASAKREVFFAVDLLRGDDPETLGHRRGVTAGTAFA
jgi:hypothetical protein